MTQALLALAWSEECGPLPKSRKRACSNCGLCSSLGEQLRTPYVAPYPLQVHDAMREMRSRNKLKAFHVSLRSLADNHTAKEHSIVSQGHCICQCKRPPFSPLCAQLIRSALSIGALAASSRKSSRVCYSLTSTAPQNASQDDVMHASSCEW